MADHVDVAPDTTKPSDDPLLYLVQCKELLRTISDNSVVASAGKALHKNIDECRENLYKAMKILHESTDTCGTPKNETMPISSLQSWARQIQIDQVVECNYKCGDGWYRGKVTAILEREHKAYMEVEREIAVQYSFENNAGDDTELLPLHSTRPCAPMSLSMTHTANAAKAAVGDLVDVVYKGEEGWFAAKIKGLRVTTAAVPRVPTSFNVEYPDGEIEEDVPPEHVRFAWRPLDVIYAECCHAVAAEAQSPQKIQTQDRDAQFEDAEVASTGTDVAQPVEATKEDLTIALETASEPPRTEVTPPLPTAAPLVQTDPNSPFEKEELVETLVTSQTRGGRWFDAWIRKVNSNGTFDVEYTDGHKPRFESAVSLSRLRHKATEPNCVIQ